jgi:hypothetical protein
MFDDNEPLSELRGILWRELGPTSASLPTITNDLQHEPAAQLRSRIRSLRNDVVGATG